MALRYCVFWIPTLFHTEIEPINFLTKEKDISDDAACSHHVRVDLDRVSADITIHSSSNASEFDLTLHKINSSRNGLFSYSYELTEEVESAFVGGVIPNAIYHMVKGFYHEHCYHKPECDSVLDAFVSDSEIDIKGMDNEALKHYIIQYEEKFSAFCEQIKYDLDFLQCNSADTDQKFVAFGRRKELNNRCINVLGEYLYCLSLINSKYNGCCKDDRNCKLYRSVINIENAVNNIKLLQEQNLAEFNFKNALVNLRLAFDADKRLRVINDLSQQNQESLAQSDRLGKQSLKLGRWGLFIGILGFLIGIISCIKS